MRASTDVSLWRKSSSLACGLLGVLLLVFGASLTGVYAETAAPADTALSTSTTDGSPRLLAAVTGKNAAGKSGRTNAAKKNADDDGTDGLLLDPPAVALDEATLLQLRQLPPDTLESLRSLYQQVQFQNRSISQELKDDQERSVQDLAMLWQAAVERSGTIRYAIEKLSRRDATGKPVEDDGFTRKTLQSIARLGGVASSMWTGTPAGLLGGSLVDEALHKDADPMAVAQRPITDADMLILAKAVDGLQAQVIETYYQYQYAKERLSMARQSVQLVAKYSQRLQEQSGLDSAVLQVLQPVMDSLFQSVQQDEDTAKQELTSGRNALGLLVGPDALNVIETAGSPTKSKASSSP
ncbi:MAG: hypothetical protein SFZ03_11150 [Candidatus Melainabacteria bacterium]|nr:hypothetical protein [Candidatus Melainabacteria bacterium]